MSGSEDESAKNKSIKKEESSVQTLTENFEIEMPRDDELKIHAFDGSDYKIRIIIYYMIRTTAVQNPIYFL